VFSSGGSFCLLVTDWLAQFSI